MNNRMTVKDFWGFEDNLKKMGLVFTVKTEVTNELSTALPQLTTFKEFNIEQAWHHDCPITVMLWLYDKRRTALRRASKYVKCKAIVNRVWPCATKIVTGVREIWNWVGIVCGRAA